MHLRAERVRLETERHLIEGTLALPAEGYRSRTTDFLTAHEGEFLALTDAVVEWVDGSRPTEQRAFVAVSTRHVVLVTELGTLGAVDEHGRPA
jgi:hypothetical protein